MKSCELWKYINAGNTGFMKLLSTSIDVIFNYKSYIYIYTGINLKFCKKNIIFRRNFRTFNVDTIIQEVPWVRDLKSLSGSCVTQTIKSDVQDCLLDHNNTVRF